jgi:hypothetical protein
MSLVLGVEILGEYKNLTAATKGAQSQLGALNKRAAKISAGMNKAFAAIGIGFSLRIVTQQLEEAAKAAIEDTKSMDLLALAMENSANATKDQIAQAEKSINRMQFQAGVADDELRPAFQKLFIATKDVTQSNRLLQIALDASAATGKDLDTISQAMARSLAGSDTALTKLIPSLKGAKDPMAELERLFAGAAEEAANTDPYQRMQIIFGEIQEQIGMALLPTLNKLSKWLATPEGQKKLQDLVDLTVKVLTAFVTLGDWVIENKDWLLPVVASIGSVTAAFNIAIVAANAFKAAATLSLSAGALGAGGAVAGIGAGAAAGGFMQGQQTAVNSQIYGEGFKQLGSKTLGKTTSNAPINLNIKATQSAQQITQTLSKGVTSSGTNINSLISGGGKVR